MSGGQGRREGRLGKLVEVEVLSSEAEELLLCSGEGLSSTRGLKLGPNPFCRGCHPCVKMTKLPSALVVIARNRIAMARFCPGEGHRARSPRPGT